ncbi:MAG: DUF3135 domain-containing protein [Ectothiorhodospiraceae bacterium]|nr:DUF3135 domain-containing protein [Ectothiorhodospiraceae bacterium]
MSIKHKEKPESQYPHPDFDELRTLAKEDPAKFESKRIEYIESFLTRIPAEKQRRLRGLQWQIDQARKLARTPMASCLSMMNMMWDSLHHLNDHQRTLVKITSAFRKNHRNSLRPSASAYREKAIVIPFPAR